MISKGFILSVAMAAALAGAAAAAAVHEPDAKRKATLVLVSENPITVAGRNFLKRERVTIRVSIDGRSLSKVIKASSTGQFTARFSETATGQCDLVVASAVGAAGSRATTRKIEIPPACGIAPQP